MQTEEKVFTMHVKAVRIISGPSNFQALHLVAYLAD
ncbi:MAG: hypothetical protein ACI9RO_001445 [Alteromonas macleodii]|jgi:hypothetical protein